MTGQVQVGTYQVDTDLSKAEGGVSLSNDQALYIGRVNLKVIEMNRSKDQFHFSFRDHYNTYGAVDSRLLVLEPENAGHLREFSYKRPHERNRLYFNLGRFQTREFGIMANDGAEIGYHLSDGFRTGAILGLLPTIYSNPYRSHKKGKENVGRSQQGLYFVYDGGRVSKHLSSLYTTNSLIHQNAPTLREEGRENHILLHHQGLVSIYDDHRIFTLLDLESAAGLAVRRARASYHYFSRRFRSNLFYYQNSGKYFLPSDPKKVVLVPSGVNLLGAHLQYRFGPSFSLKSRLESGKRSIDSATNSEFSCWSTDRAIFE